jgi:hypothetical protein
LGLVTTRGATTGGVEAWREIPIGRTLGGCESRKAEEAYFSRSNKVQHTPPDGHPHLQPKSTPQPSLTASKSAETEETPARLQEEERTKDKQK